MNKTLIVKYFEKKPWLTLVLGKFSLCRSTLLIDIIQTRCFQSFAFFFAPENSEFWSQLSVEPWAHDPLKNVLQHISGFKWPVTLKTIEFSWFGRRHFRFLITFPLPVLMKLSYFGFYLCLFTCQQQQKFKIISLVREIQIARNISQSALDLRNAKN